MPTDEAACGCCEAPAPRTPLRVENRPGLSAIAYRIGTFATFREAMLEAIARQPALSGLTTRRSDDAAITLLELWAAVADVLTFYQERIANESYLRTARERDSVLRMVRMLDYHLRPGLAAAAWLAFACEAGKAVWIPVGLRVMSTPAQDETPQFFETVETIGADARLNRIAVLPAPQLGAPLRANIGEAFILSDEGGRKAAAALAPREVLVAFDASGAASTSAVEELEVRAVEAAADRYRVTWTRAPARTWDPTAQVWKVKQKVHVFGHSAPRSYPYFQNLRSKEPKYKAAPPEEPSAHQLRLDSTYDDLKAGDRLLVVGPNTKPTLTAIESVWRSEEYLGERLGVSTDARYHATVTSAQVTSGVGVTNRWQTTIYVLEGEPIPFWGASFPSQIAQGPLYVPAFPRTDLDPSGDTYEMSRTIEGMAVKPGPVMRLDEWEKGRTVLLADYREKPISAVLSAVPVPELVRGQWFLKLDITLDPSVTVKLDTATAHMLGNVARATHGQTVRDQPLGSGDATVPFQTLKLVKAPLTYTSSPKSPSGESTLKVLVNGELWQETPSFYGQSPRARAYIARQADDGTTTVQFGDGETGARLPTGVGNVNAAYRQGSGLAGRVKAGQLNILLERPVGLQSVTNPLDAEGGSDPETLATARASAPTKVVTFGRAISITDFELLATASGEVARARATWVWHGLEKAVHLTVAQQGGQPFSAEALARLHSGLTAARDPNRVLLIDNLVRVPVFLSALIAVCGDHVREQVLADVRAAVLAYFRFESQPIARPVHLSHLYGVMQAVEGVRYVDINAFHYRGEVTTGWSPAGLAARGATADPVQPHLRFFAARPRTDPVEDPIAAAYTAAHAEATVFPAEQACLETPGQDLTLIGQGGL